MITSAFVRFVREGLGTPMPMAPRSDLVLGGVYRYVRNPMYLALASTVLGQALMLGSRRLLLYVTVMALRSSSCLTALPVLGVHFVDVGKRSRIAYN